MSDKKDDGGQAFPTSDIGWGPTWGMTLRDYFAGQALVAMGDRRWEGDDKENATQKSAKAAYAIADAMLAARNT